MAAPTNLGIVALPFEVSTSFMKGTIHAPEAILNELDRLDVFDFELARDPFRKIPRTIVLPHGPELVDARIQQAVAGRVVGEVMDGNGFPICLGGEHSVSLGPVRAARARWNIGVVQLDAHGDLRDSYEGNPLSHACVMRRIVDLGCPTLGVGIRSMCAEEAAFIEENDLQVVGAREVIGGRGWYSRLDALPEHIYLTIDMDFFDPSDVPAVGTPEPGGPSWYDAVSFLTHLFATKNVVAADIVELMPGENDDASVRLATRLIGLLVGLRFPPR
jgi:agmatinase